MGLSSALNVGISAMQAAQLGLDVTSQNISNVNTDGYSRKVLTLSASARYDEAYGQMGFGVEVNNIRRMRNDFVDIQIRQQLNAKGSYEQINTTLERIENIFTEPQDTGLANYMEDFWNAWQDLANNPADFASRSVVQSRGQVLVDVLHNIGAELQDLRASQNDLLEAKVKRVNELLQEIYTLNKEISQVEVTGQKANDSRDQRDVLIKELSQYIDTTVIEDANGAATITSSGNMMVSGVNYSQIETFTTTFTNPDGTTRLDQGLRIGSSKKVFRPLDGEITGILRARDEVIPFYQEKLDTLVEGLVTEVNELHVTGYDMQGFTGTYFFDPQKTSATDIQLSAAIQQSPLFIAAASGGTALADTTTIAAGTTVLGVAQQLVGDTSGLLNKNIFRTGLMVTSGGMTLTENSDYTIDYINGTLTVINGAWAGAPLLVTGSTGSYRYQSGASKGPGDGSNAIAIAQLRQMKTMELNQVNQDTATFEEFYGGMVGTLGINRNEAIANVDSRNMLVRYLEKQQDSVAGVSLDEEMANMVKFEHSFSAAARIITVVDEMFQTLLQM